MSTVRHGEALEYRRAFEAAPGLYLLVAPDMTVVGASEAYLAAMQTPREAIVGRSVCEVFSNQPDDPQGARARAVRESLEKAMRDKRPDELAALRYDLPRPDGGWETRYRSCLNLPVLDERGEVAGVLHSLEDATGPAHELAEANRRLEGEWKQRQQFDRQNRHAQKMEAVGRLAGGVAHDFNNLLTVITGYGEMLMKAENDPGRRRKLELMLEASERASTLTRQLLAFSRQQVMDLKVLDLNAVIAHALPTLRGALGEAVELVTAPAADLGPIKADAGQVGQVLMNLAANARDAMPQGGVLTIETANVTLDTTFGGRHGAAVPPGPYVMMAVTDTGSGMDAATQERIFEPFFTTKTVNVGTGLGLATVYGIVKQCGGNIWVYSEPGRGASFKIYFPRVDAPAAAPARGAAARGIEGGETILLVEDEEAVRQLVQSVLEDQGYRVLAAGNGEEALAVVAAEARPEARPIDLLLTDLVMPGMTGRQVGDAVRRVFPRIAVVYSSGYTDDTVIRQGLVDDGKFFLQKPFRSVELLGKVRDALEAARMEAGPKCTAKE